MPPPPSDKIERDPEVIKDFLGEFQDAYEDLQRTLVLVDRSPADAGLINRLFRVLHSIKSNLHMMGLVRLADIMHSLENIIEELRDQRVRYSAGISDILLLVTHRVGEFSRALFANHDIDEDLQKLSIYLQVVCMVEPSQLPGAISKVLHQIDPDRVLREAEERSALASPREVLTEGTETSAAIPAAVAANAPALANDLEYFLELGALMERSLPHSEGRHQRILDLCLTMNAEAGQTVDATQLTAAVYLHDFGMAFMPADILHKTEALSTEEAAILRRHCHVGYQWLRRLPGWDEAATMVHHHHERMDGKGYPQGLGGEAIAAGARIIAIADTFDAMTSRRAWREHKRPVMRAVLEINSGAGHQFDSQWVAAFNAVIKRRSTVKNRRQ